MSPTRAKAPSPQPRRSIVRSRTRLAGALRKLEEALARDPRDFGRRVREFGRRFHDYSPFNRIMVFLQRPDATFVKGKQQWAAEGRTVKRGTRAIQILAPVLEPGEYGPTRRFTQAKVYDVADTEGPPFDVPVLAPDTGGRDELVGRALAELEAWVRGSGLGIRYEAPTLNAVVDGATDGRTIWIRPDLKPPERLLVIAHEIAHAEMHFERKQRGQLTLFDDEPVAASRDVRELQAELTAFLLLEISGIDSSIGSAAYLAEWNASMRAIREHAERCLTVACSVLRACETRRYRTLVDRGRVGLIEETWTALEVSDPIHSALACRQNP